MSFSKWIAVNLTARNSLWMKRILLWRWTNFIKIFVFQSKFIRIGNQHLMKKSFLMINHMIEDLLICEITTTMCDENNVCCSSNELFRSPRIYVEFCSELNIQLVVNSCKYLGIEYTRDRLLKTIFFNQYDYLNWKLKMFNKADSRKVDTPFAAGIDPCQQSPSNVIYPYRQEK